MGSPEPILYKTSDFDLDNSSWDGDSYNFTNCSNDYCISDEDYIDAIENYIFPSVFEWFLITIHCIVFIVGLVGNFLVCLAVYRNHTMRTVTNLFIVNLAIADFLVIFLCLPPTVLWDVSETWFLGNTLCKIVPYVQVTSISFFCIFFSYLFFRLIKCSLLIQLYFLCFFVCVWLRFDWFIHFTSWQWRTLNA